MIPRLQYGNKLYYATMKSPNGSLAFNVRTASITDLSLPVGFTPASATDIVGTFTNPDGSEITIDPSCTYSLKQAANVDADCSSGGIETGTYQYDATTGVFEPVTITSDNNKTCGLSDPGDQDSPTRIKKIGSNLFLYIRDSGQFFDVPLTRKP